MPPGAHLLNLQSTLAAGSALGPAEIQPKPHHPITCQSTLFLEEDGCLSCEHATADPGDRRTRACIDHTVALLIIELACAL